MNCEFGKTTLRYRTETTIAEGVSNSMLDSDSGMVELKQFIVQENLIAEQKITLSIKLKNHIAIEYLSSELIFKNVSGVSCLDRYYECIQNAAVIYINDQTPLSFSFTQEGKMYYLFNTDKKFASKICFNKQLRQLTIECVFEAAALHPEISYRTGFPISFASPIISDLHLYQLNIGFLEVDVNFKPPVISRFPHKNEAVFIMTDHCDYDAGDKLKVFLHGDGKSENSGWRNRNLKITKGVFINNSPSNNPPKSDSLQNERYKDLISDLFLDGSAIVPHALSHSEQFSSTEVSQAVQKLDSLFKPRIWIDHGSSFKYCYTMGGVENADYRLLALLKRYNYNAVWGFFDVPTDSLYSLNIINNKKYSEFRRVPIFFKYLFKLKPLNSLYQIRSYIHRSNKGSRFSLYLMSVITMTRQYVQNYFAKRMGLADMTKSIFKNLFKMPSKSEKVYQPYTVEEINNFASVLFTTDKLPFYKSKKDDILVFNTQEANQAELCYTSKNISKLVEQKGIHIGHNYILNTLPHLAGIFSNKKKLMLSKVWVRFIAKLSELVSHNLLWNPNLEEYVDYTRDINNLQFKYFANKLVVENANEHAIDGLSFYVSSKIDNAFYYYWNNAPVEPSADFIKKGYYIAGNILGNSMLEIRWEKRNAI